MKPIFFMVSFMMHESNVPEVIFRFLTE